MDAHEIVYWLATWDEETSAIERKQIQADVAEFNNCVEFDSIRCS